MANRHRRSVALNVDDPLAPQDHCPSPDANSVARLYRDHGTMLTRFLRRRLAGEGASDLLHHVFARFLALAPHKRAAIRSTEAYLRQSASNLVRDERKLALRRSAGQHLPESEVCLTAPCQIAALEARDVLNRIEQAIRKLKPITQQIFLAHRLDGYSYAEIAELTGLSVKAVEKHMSRAIAHIDRTLTSR